MSKRQQISSTTSNGIKIKTNDPLMAMVFTGMALAEESKPRKQEGKRSDRKPASK